MQTVIGLFENSQEAQKAVQQLMSHGFTSENIDVSDNGNSAAAGSYGTSDDLDRSSGSDTSAGAGSTYSTSYNSGSTSYDSDSSSRNTSGNRDNDDSSFGTKVSNFFKNLFDNDEDEVNRYSHVANKAGSIVTVHAQSSDEAARAADILDEYGAINVDERAAAYGYSGTSGNDSNYSGSLSDDNTSDKLNVIKEDIKIGKKEVETGGVRLRSRIVERPIEEKLRLKEERVTVERNSVDRPATTADLQNFKEGEIEMTEYAEIADVTKEARVVEEVRLSKEVDERTETISEVARDVEVDVEDLSKRDNWTNTKNSL